MDSEAIKEAIESAVGPMMTKMTSALRSQKRAMEEMSMELLREEHEAPAGGSGVDGDRGGAEELAQLTGGRGGVTQGVN